VAWRFVGGLAALGVAVAVLAIALAPWGVPFVFGSKYRDAVPTVQVFMLALPFIYATNVLLAYVYSARRETLVLVVTLVISGLGTCAVLVGQALGGSTAAAAGVVLRQAMFTVALLAIAIGMGRSKEAALGRAP
jgi:O-antigen/teichoic acid export membrane protein